MYTISEYIGKIQPKLFLRPGGDHGVMHTYRVMVLAAELASKLNISQSDFKTLMCACCYHDIGRIHDFSDSAHGQRSAQRCVRENLFEDFNLTSEAQATAIKLMTYHAQSDSMFIASNEQEQILYNIIKDADALDRLRFYDLDVKYLRLKDSYDLVGFANLLLNQYPRWYNYSTLGIS